jgi:hypothetical protein
MPVPFPYFYCPYCRQRVIFPFPTTEEPVAHLQRLPDDSWKIYFVCWHCSKMYLLRAADIQMMLPHRSAPDHWSSNPTFYRVQCQCVQKDCSSIVTMFLSTKKVPLSEREAERTLSQIFPRPLCPNGHVLHPDTTVDTLTEVFSLL